MNFPLNFPSFYQKTTQKIYPKILQYKIFRLVGNVVYFSIVLRQTKLHFGFAKREFFA